MNLIGNLKNINNNRILKKMKKIFKEIIDGDYGNNYYSLYIS